MYIEVKKELQPFAPGPEKRTFGLDKLRMTLQKEVHWYWMECPLCGSINVFDDIEDIHGFKARSVCDKCGRMVDKKKMQIMRGGNILVAEENEEMVDQ